MFLDNNDLFVTSNMDGGDTAQHEGMVEFGNSLSDAPIHRMITYTQIIGLLEPKADGNWIRNPEVYTDPTDFSRDQARSNIIAMGHRNFKEPLKRMFKAQLKRFMLYQNHDVPNPQNFGEYVRAFRFYPLYPLLLLGDIFLLLDTLNICFIKARTPGKIKRWLGKNIHWIFMQGESNNAYGVPRDVYGPDNVGTDKNHILSLLQAKLYMATPISYLARKIYKICRPLGPQYALDHYFRNENQEIAQMMKSVLEKHL